MVCAAGAGGDGGADSASAAGICGRVGGVVLPGDGVSDGGFALRAGDRDTGGGSGGGGECRRLRGGVGKTGAAEIGCRRNGGSAGGDRAAGGGGEDDGGRGDRRAGAGGAGAGGSCALCLPSSPGCSRCPW